MIETNPKETTVFVAMYNSIESFPPTLNAIHELSPRVKEIVCLTPKKLTNSKWVYPDNVRHIYSHKENPKKNNRWQTVQNYFRFIRLFRSTMKSIEPDILLVYDGIALGLINMSKVDISAVKTKWYHNHDVFDMGYVNSFSFTSLLAKQEQKGINNFDVITIPAKERLKHFPTFNGKKFVLPNYPRVQESNKQFPQKETPTDNSIDVIYQGRISNAHGLEELIVYMASKPKIRVNLHLVGFVKASYKNQLIAFAEKNRVQNQIDFQENIPYENLYQITSKYHIGWAVNKPITIMYKTGGTASNKIYEYASAGLPIVYFDGPGYSDYLNKFPWAFPCDLKPQTIGDIFEKILTNFEVLANQAHYDFLSSLNFNTEFGKLLKTQEI